MNPWTHLMPSGRLAFVQMKHFMVTLLDTPLMFLTYPKVQSSCVACHGDLSFGWRFEEISRRDQWAMVPAASSLSISVIAYATALTVVAGDAQGLARNPLTPSTLPNKITQRSESLQDPPCALLEATWVNWHLWKQYPASHFEKLLSWESIQHADNW